ncbi:MAG: hypothetical protein ACOYL1_00055 [Chlamydiia bacterium]
MSHITNITVPASVQNKNPEGIDSRENKVQGLAKELFGMLQTEGGAEELANFFLNAKTDLINQNLEIATLRAANTDLKLKGTSREVQLDIAKTEIGNLKEHVTYLTARLNEVKTDLTGRLEKVKIEELGRSLSNAQKQNLVLKRLIFGVAAVAGGFFAYLGVKRA